MEAENNQDFIEIAEGLKGNVTRKVIKQTVMTSVYGVTFIGAR
jgi:DNA-directed RNA polymerase